MHTISGIVIKGAQRGKDIGFPTANFLLSEPVEEGIYVSEVKVNGLPSRAVTFIGAAKTFDEDDVKVETYILDFNADLYGEKLTVRLLKKIRNNIKFTSIPALTTQIQIDVQQAREYDQAISG